MLPWESQTRMVYEINSAEPTATCHLQPSPECEALCGFPWENLIEIPDGRTWRALDDWLRCDLCEDACADRALQRYRRAAATVYDGEEPVGRLGVRLVVWWEELGPFWRRRRENVGELPEWGLLRTTPEHPALPYEFEDGVIQDEQVAQELRAWAADTFPLRGTTLRLQWLNGDEVDSVHRELGWME